MTPDYFPQANKTFESQDKDSLSDPHSVPGYTDGVTCITKWRMTWRERWSALVFGRVWIHCKSGDYQPEMAASCKRRIF